MLSSLKRGSINEQKYKIMNVDTRSFGQIWEGLSRTEKDNLTVRLMRDLSCSDSALRNYRLQNRRPSPLVQRTMAKTIRKTTGIPVSPAYLFPDTDYAKSLRKSR